MDFLTDILAGLIIAFGYDFFRALRHRSNRKNLGALLDILFWLFTGGVTLAALFYTSDMELRAYEFLGMLTGVCFYFTALSHLFLPFHQKLADVFYFFWKILFTTVSFFAIMIKKGLLFLWIPVRLFGVLVKKMLVKPIRAFREHRKQIKRI